jgi:hypothetical protein
MLPTEDLTPTGKIDRRANHGAGWETKVRERALKKRGKLDAHL